MANHSNGELHGLILSFAEALSSFNELFNFDKIFHSCKKNPSELESCFMAESVKDFMPTLQRNVLDILVKQQTEFYPGENMWNTFIKKSEDYDLHFVYLAEYALSNSKATFDEFKKDFGKLMNLLLGKLKNIKCSFSDFSHITFSYENAIKELEKIRKVECELADKISITERESFKQKYFHFFRQREMKLIEPEYIPQNNGFEQKANQISNNVNQKALENFNLNQITVSEIITDPNSNKQRGNDLSNLHIQLTTSEIIPQNMQYLNKIENFENIPPIKTRYFQPSPNLI